MEPISLKPGNEIGDVLQADRDHFRSAARGIGKADQDQGEDQESANDLLKLVYAAFHPTNAKVVTSIEELQFINEELVQANALLQQTLGRQRSMSNNLQSILESTNVATLFLDRELNIRFFTSVTSRLFNVMASDIGRPLVGLASLAHDVGLAADALYVLTTLKPVECETQAPNGTWYSRRVLPYRTQTGSVEGLVITFVDTTDRKQAGEALKVAKQQAQSANTAKSRFLSAASHDLRQPLQSLTLIQGMMAKAAYGNAADKLVRRFEETLVTMSGMLDTFLDISQIESGTMRTELLSFPINGMLDRLRDEFSEIAKSQGLSLRVVGCRHPIKSDPRLLEIMIRNLMSNALKYTNSGKVLLGCRKQGSILRIEVWDTGKGIPETELEAIFEEYHQLDNSMHERSLGLGLGLSIVARMGNLLDHAVKVRSRLGKGSTFIVETPIAANVPASASISNPKKSEDISRATLARGDTVLVIEDDSVVSDQLSDLLLQEGYQVVIARTGTEAVTVVRTQKIRPDLILTDFNLPDGLNGLEARSKIWKAINYEPPTIVLTGEITDAVLRDISLNKCVRMNKPVRTAELARVISRLLAIRSPTERNKKPLLPAKVPTIYVIDDNELVRSTMDDLLTEAGHSVETFSNAESFLASFTSNDNACLLIDAGLPGMSGLQLIQKLEVMGSEIPSIMITGRYDVPLAVQSMKSGAIDFLEKPVGSGELLICVNRALELSRDHGKREARREDALRKMGGITQRQREIMNMVLEGHPSKNIAADLGISQRTVENHRASIMKRTGAKSLPALARLAVAAATI